MNPFPFQRIAIFGPGLLGGSLALACHARHPEVRVRVWGRREAAVRALADAALAELASTDVAAVAEGAELVILCVPVERMAALAAQMAEHLPEQAVVTDVGSVKAMVHEQVASALRGRAHFVGSHPMAGSEQTGFESARADLFEGATCLVTPDPEPPDPSLYEAQVARVAQFWCALGCHVTQLTPAAHDAAVGWISHLPHLLAAALVNTVAERAPDALAFCGPGFRDTTRVAAGPPEMWTGIFTQNRAALRDSTEAMIEKLRDFATLLDGIDESGVRQRLTAAKLVRDRLHKH